jgi:hypothetical protein
MSGQAAMRSVLAVLVHLITIQKATPRIIFGVANTQTGIHTSGSGPASQLTRAAQW